MPGSGKYLQLPLCLIHVPRQLPQHPLPQDFPATCGFSPLKSLGLQFAAFLCFAPPAQACAYQQAGDLQGIYEQQRRKQRRRAEVALHLSVTFAVSVSSCSVCGRPVKLETDPQNKKKQRSLPVSPERNSSGCSNPIIHP